MNEPGRLIYYKAAASRAHSKKASVLSVISVRDSRSPGPVNEPGRLIYYKRRRTAVSRKTFAHLRALRGKTILYILHILSIDVQNLRAFASSRELFLRALRVLWERFSLST